MPDEKKVPTIQDNAVMIIPPDNVEAIKKLVGGPVIRFIESMLDEIALQNKIIKGRVVVSKEDNTAVTEAVKRLKILNKKLEEKRLEVSGIHRNRQQRTNDFFKLFSVQIDTGGTAGLTSSTAYLREEERKAKEAARIEQERLDKEAEERAAALRKEAEELTEVATDEESYPDEEMREVALDDADRLESAANAVEAAPVEVERTIQRTGFATSSLRKAYSAKVVDVSKIPVYILKKPKVVEAITTALSAIARSDKETFDIEGAELVTTEKAGIR